MRNFIWAAGGGLAIVLAIALFTSTFGQHDRHLRLENGSEIRLRKITYGTNHAFTPGPIWHRLLAPMLTTNLAARLGINTMQIKDEHSGIGVWVETVGVFSNAPAIFAVLVDRHGYEGGAENSETRRQLDTNQWLYGYIFTSFPRRDEEFR